MSISDKKSEETGRNTTQTARQISHPTPKIFTSNVKKLLSETHLDMQTKVICHVCMTENLGRIL